MIALKPVYKTREEIEDLRKKFAKLKCTVSTYKTKYGTTCVLYIYWQGQEKAAQLQDYGYWIVFKSFVDNMFYTDYKQWLDK